MTEDPKQAALHRAFYGDPNRPPPPPEEVETPPPSTFIEKIRWKIKIDDPSLHHIRRGAAWLFIPLLIFGLLFIISFVLNLPVIMRPGLFAFGFMLVGCLRILLGLFQLLFGK